VKKTLVLLALWPAAACALTITDVVTQMERKEKEISAMSFQFEQKIQFTAMETESSAKGQAHFAKGGRFRIEKKKPEEQLIVSDGKILNVYTPSFKQMWRGPWKGWEKAAMVPKGFVPLNDFVADLNKNFDLTLAAKSSEPGQVQVNAVPKDADAGYRLELAVSKTSWLIEAIKYISDSAVVVTKLSMIEINPPHPDGFFKLKAPRGVEIISLN